MNHAIPSPEPRTAGLVPTVLTALSAVATAAVLIAAGFPLSSAACGEDSAAHPLLLGTSVHPAHAGLPLTAQADRRRTLK